jgi:CHAT domain-containing protein/Tfp pilus assembly protein PilF
VLDLGELYEILEQFAKAERLYQRSLKIREALLKEKPSDATTNRHVAQSLNSLAHLYQRLDQLARAEPLYERSLKIREAKLGKDHPDVAQSVNNLAHLLWRKGQYQRAEALSRRCLKIYVDKRGENSLEVATARNNLAMLLADKGQYLDAEELLTRSLAIRKEKLGSDSLPVAESMTNLAIVYWRMGQYARAESWCLRGLLIREQKKDLLAVAYSRNNLGLLYRDMGKHDKAESCLRRALDIREQKLDADHFDVAASLSNLAGLYRDRGRYREAEKLYLRSLAITEKRLGKDHPDQATNLYALAELYRRTGKHEKALSRFQRVLEIREQRLGKNHPEVARSLNALAVQKANAGRYSEAARLFDRGQRTNRRYVAQILPALSEREQMDFLKIKYEKDFQTALSLSLERPTDSALAAQAAIWLVNGKAVASEALALPVLRARERSNPAAGKLMRQLDDVRQRLAQLTMVPFRADQEKRRREQLDELTVREQELAKQLRRTSSATLAPVAWRELDAMRSALPAGTAFIDVVRLRGFDFKAPASTRRPAARYAAWITQRTGSPRVVDLGSAERIDAAIQRVRAGLRSAVARIKGSGEEKAEQSLRQHLEALSKLVLAPLLPHAGSVTRLLISPDGNLWLVPWEALLLRDGTYAIEKYRIGYLTSGRDLLPASHSRVKSGASLVMADPDFDLGSARKRPVLLAAAGAGPFGKVERLEGTGAEAKAIIPNLAKYAGTAPVVYMREQAVKSRFKAARHPRVVVMCTHGFFRPDQLVNQENQRKLSRGWQNPLLRCGLLLAGCNRTSNARGGADDGVLTGLEVVGVDLRGCELVVLSACDTGLGEVLNGEGVSGLRLAFQLAGARAVVSTLWKVPDEQSARLMTFFFRNLAGGMSRDEALRQAKIHMIAERRDSFAAAHPLFWAAFTLTGEPGDQPSSPGNNKAVAETARKLGDDLTRQGRYEEALKAYSEAIRATPEDGMLWARRSRVYSRLQRHQEAVADGDQAVRLRDSATTRSARGLALLGKGDSRRALADFEKALRFNAKHKYALCYKGQVLAKQGNHAEAITSYSLAIEVDKGYRAAYQGRAKSYDALGETAKARADRARLATLLREPQ